MNSAHQTRAEYDARVKQLNDMRAAQSVKYNEGLAEGEKIGIEKGEKNAKIETAKNLLKMGLSAEQIVQATGLSVDEISNLIH